MVKKTFDPIKILSMAAPVALVAGLALAPQAWAGSKDMRYVEDTSKQNWKTNYGECWVSQGQHVDSAACGDKVAEKVAEKPSTECKDEDKDGVCDDKDKCPGTRPGARVDADGCEIVADKVFTSLEVDQFDFDKAILKPPMKKALDKYAAEVKGTPGDEKLLVIGHTDSKGKDAYNMKLGQRRADAVKAYLTKKGIAADHMTTKSMGESQPIASNDTDKGRAQNRRVEIQVK